MAANLYFITHSVDGFDRDLLVVAHNRQDAMEAWLSYWDYKGRGELVDKVDGLDADDDPTSGKDYAGIMKVTLTGKLGSVSWNCKKPDFSKAGHTEFVGHILIPEE